MFAYRYLDVGSDIAPCRGQAVYQKKTKNLPEKENINQVYFVDVRNHPGIWDARKHLLEIAFKFE